LALQEIDNYVKKYVYVKVVRFTPARPNYIGTGWVYGWLLSNPEL